ncbi:MAG: DUF484 family protein [Xanthomonadales bacterium]|nr:DUF484 family protein [Xanthomonadales bacterium]
MSESPRRELEAADVAVWLREHPNFFLHHPDVALAIDLPRENGRATSLASYQLDVLREKNRELNRRLQELFANANENERLTVRTHQFTLALLRAQNLPQTLAMAVGSLREDFSSEWVRILLSKPGLDVVSSPWWTHADRESVQMAAFADLKPDAEPLSGRLQADKLDALFGADAAQVQSSALVPLGDYGVLAIGSSDPNHFYPGMGTFFVRLMAQALVAALARFDTSVPTP